MNITHFGALLSIYKSPMYSFQGHDVPENNIWTIKKKKIN